MVRVSLICLLLTFVKPNSDVSINLCYRDSHFYRLGFCVERHDAILSFVPKPFWTISPVLSHEGRTLTVKWLKGRVFDKATATKIEKLVKSEREAKIISVVKKEGSKQRPIGLNTIELLKVASSNFRIL